jgi:hypothetical protein
MNTKLTTKTKYMGAVITLTGLFIFFAVPGDMFTSTVFPLDTDVAVSAPDGGEGVDYIYTSPELYGYEEDSCSETASSNLVSLSLIETFAPQLRFDHLAGTFPMSAQVYFQKVIEGPLDKLENLDVATLTTPGMEPPTYYKAFMVGNQIRIMYWWFYGWQPGCVDLCIKFGYHHGDWERVMVILSEDQSSVAAVTFWQHSGWYTRLSDGGDLNRDSMGTNFGDGLEFYDTTHPVIYVGKMQHGSYYNEGGIPSFCIWFPGYPQCPYFADLRHNEDNLDYRLDTQKNLVSLSDQAEPWMLESALDNYLQIGTGDGITTIFELDSKYVFADSVNIWVDDVLLNVNAWSFSDGTGTNGKDQIVLHFAPDAGALITALYDKGDFNWGPGGEGGVYGHPMHESTTEKVRILDACKGLKIIGFGTAGCFDSQCRFFDNQDNYITAVDPGKCISEAGSYNLWDPIPPCDHGLCQPLYDHFSDIPLSHWAHFTTGCTPTTYCPANNVTRAQMAVYIIRSLEGDPVAGYCGGVAPFTDVGGTHWACGHIKRLSELNISQGYPDGSYKPWKNVSRAEMAVYIVRAIEGDPPYGYCGGVDTFSDVGSAHWACGHIKRLSELGISIGYPDGTYKPTKTVSRAEMAVYVGRAFLGMP